jgi:hypothetical protein
MTAGLNSAEAVTVKGALKRLTVDVVQALERSGQDSASFRGIAFYNTEKDTIITEQVSFDSACEKIKSVPLVADRYGRENAVRLTLQCVYQVIPLLVNHELDEAIDSLWTDFLEELNEPQWIFRAVSNLRHFTLESDTQLEPIDGVTIAGRSLDDLAVRGFDRHITDALVQDWGGFGSSSYVLLVEAGANKTPDNLVLSSDGTLWVKGTRLMGAMRLVSAGDVSMDQMFLARPARFNVGIGGYGRTGWSIPAPPGGCTYTLTSEIWARARDVYANLEYLESHGYNRGPGNLDLALRSFMTTYDRWPSAPDAQLIDAITAAEAVLGTETEITFRLAFRIAGILAADSAERGRIYQSVKTFYDARSKLVHGGALKAKHHKAIAQVHELRGYVRQLLEALVRLAASTSPKYDRAFFSEKLDIVLQDEDARQSLRADLGV